MKKAGHVFGGLFRALPKNSTPTISIVSLIFLSFLLHNPTPAYGLSYGPAPLDESVRNCDLIVLGKLIQVDHDLVEYKGDRYSKRTGLIRVERVLVKSGSEKVPDVIRIYWGTDLFLAGQQLMRLGPCRFRRGAWLLSRIEESDDFRFLGAEGDLYIPEMERTDLVHTLSDIIPLSASIIRRGNSHILRVKHMNFGDASRQALSWHVDNSQLLVPPPYQLVIFGYDPENPKERQIKARSEPLDLQVAEKLEVPPHTYIKREFDVSGWVADAGEMQGGYYFRLDIEGKPDMLLPESRPLNKILEGDRHSLLFLQGDWGNPVWWFPSTAKMRWLLLVFGPLLTIAMFTFRYQGRYRLCALLLGAFLGILWAWLLVAFGLKTAIAFFLAMRGEISPKHIVIMLSMATVLFFVSVRAVRRVNCYEPHTNRTLKPGWFAILPWLAFPAIVVALSIAGERSFVLY